jgi:hypothetical protein
VHRRPGVLAEKFITGSGIPQEDIDWASRLKECGADVFQMIEGGIGRSLAGQLGCRGGIADHVACHEMLGVPASLREARPMPGTRADHEYDIDAAGDNH